MLLRSVDGSSIELVVVSYQFASLPHRDEDFDWDWNWLVVRGTVAHEGRRWQFEEPCVTTVEARRLAAWLRHLADSNAEHTDLSPDGFSQPDLAMTEPVLTFESATRSHDMASFTVVLDLEAAMPPQRVTGRHPNRLVVTLPVVDLAAAAAALQRELDEFPVR